MRLAPRIEEGWLALDAVERSLQHMHAELMKVD